jgi:hypothetical protein
VMLAFSLISLSEASPPGINQESWLEYSLPR